MACNARKEQVVREIDGRMFVATGLLPARGPFEQAVHHGEVGVLLTVRPAMSR